MEETLISFGSEVKSLGDRRIGGYVCLFGDPKSADLAGDYFTKETDFDLEDGETRSGYYGHGLDVTFGNRKIGRGEFKTDALGVWVEAKLAERDAYADAVLELVEKKAVGLSSGALSHLVRREEVKGAQKITNWPIGEWSVTVKPCDPRTQVMALKEWGAEQGERSAQALKEFVSETVSLAQAREQVGLPFKAAVLGDYVEAEMTMGALERLYSALMWSVVYSSLFNANEPLAERLARLRAGFEEYQRIALATIEAIMNGTGAEDATNAAKSIKTLWSDPDLSSPSLLAGGALVTDTEAVLAAAGSVASRYRDLASLRHLKEGRALSQSRRDRITKLRDALGEMATELEAMLAETEPKPKDGEGKSLDVLRSDTLRLHSRLLASRVGAS